MKMINQYKRNEGPIHKIRHQGRNLLVITYLIQLAFFSAGCRKFIEIAPPTSNITQASVYANDLTAIAVLDGIYNSISTAGLSTPDILSVSKVCGLSADEFNLWSGASLTEQAYYKNDLLTSLNTSDGSNAGVEMWNAAYRFMFICNQAIEGISNSTTLSTSAKNQLLGEARFIRSFLYFYLVNLYGDVPLATSSYYQTNQLLNRTPKSTIYSFIITELTAAQQLLSSSYLNSSLTAYTTNAERVRPTSWAATALLSRVYLYQGNYAQAEAMATTVINQSSLFDVSGVPLNSVFLKNSKEAIWQLQPVTVGWNTTDARWFVLSAAPAGFSTTKSVSLSGTLLQAFEPGDNRKTSWIGSYTSTSPAGTYYFPYKYKKADVDASITATNIGSMVEYEMILRIGEQYLIRAEARARQNNIGGAVADLNILRTRARATPSVDVPNPLPNLSTTLSQQDAINAVMQERRVELFSEWGHRWLDLKRTGTVDGVMQIVTPNKGGTWVTADQLYPIPAADLLNDPNLTQNPGYN